MFVSGCILHMEALLYRRKTGSIYLMWLAADHTLMCAKGYLQIGAQDLHSPQITKKARVLLDLTLWITTAYAGQLETAWPICG
jgi:hypothetical protein